MSISHTIKQSTIQLRAIKVAIIVGSILCLINHGDTIIAGDMTFTRWLKASITYVVPYAVSLYSATQALQQK